VLRKALSLVAGSLVSVLVVAGCGLVPSDPELPPVGVRQDAGILSVIVPVCPGDPVRSASVVEFFADREADAASWSATGFEGNRSQAIAFGPRDWSVVRGSYRSLTSFFIEIETDRSSFGALVDPPFLDRTKSLPSGAFLVEGVVMTPTEYAASVSRFPC